jgi:hypothetical protein
VSVVYIMLELLCNTIFVLHKAILKLYRYFFICTDSGQEVLG